MLGSKVNGQPPRHQHVELPLCPQQPGSRHPHASSRAQGEKLLCTPAFITDALSQHMGREEQPRRLFASGGKLPALFTVLSSGHLRQQRHKASGFGVVLSSAPGAALLLALTATSPHMTSYFFMRKEYRRLGCHHEPALGFGMLWKALGAQHPCPTNSRYSAASATRCPSCLEPHPAQLLSSCPNILSPAEQQKASLCATHPP